VGDDAENASEDRHIALRARDVGAIVVTENVKDFDAICGRSSNRKNKSESIHVRGCVYIESFAEAAARFEGVLTVVEALIDESELQRDRRAFIRVDRNRVILHR
jgi:hypothetical protein